jgi:hypothetical protein
VVACSKQNSIGAEIADVTIDPDRLSVQGTAIGSDPELYRLDFEVRTSSAFVTDTVRMAVTAETWGRSLEIRRGGDVGSWALAAQATGLHRQPEPHVDSVDLSDALDVDLGLSRCSTRCRCCDTTCTPVATSPATS